MFCPYCGRRFRGSLNRYCPFCGEYISDTVDLRTRGTYILEGIRSLSTPERARDRHILIIGAIAIAVMLLALVLITYPEGEPDDGPVGENILTIGDGYIELGGAFADGDLNAYVNSGNGVVIYVSNEAAEGYDEFYWILHDENSNDSDSITSTEPEMLWILPEAGRYTVTAYRIVDGESEYGSALVGTLIYRGDKDVRYSWSHLGHRNEVTATVTMDDVVRSSSADAVGSDVRYGLSPGSVSELVTTSGSVATLTDGLARCYDQWYGDHRTDRVGYASFILSFVQQCIDFAHDTENYHRSDYWAFPAETLFNGCGDEEDLAILLTSIYRSAGYGAGIVNMPGGTVSMVDIGQPPSETAAAEDHTYRTIRSGGTVYTVADPLSELPEPNLGYLRDCHSFDQYGRNFTYYGKAYTGDYGAVVC